MAGNAEIHRAPYEDLVLAARQGDRQAFGVLVERYREGVVGVVYRMCGEPQWSEEAAQEAFVHAWQRLHTYKPEFSFRNWVYAIAIHIARDIWRKESRSDGIEMLDPPGSAGAPEAALESKERAERVRRSVLELPPACRSVLILREYERLSYREIAETLNIPLGTVMSRLNYARTQLRRSLADELEAL